jgi:hypothetical protein
MNANVLQICNMYLENKCFQSIGIFKITVPFKHNTFSFNRKKHHNITYKIQGSLIFSQTDVRCNKVYETKPLFLEGVLIRCGRQRNRHSSIENLTIQFGFKRGTKKVFTALIKHTNNTIYVGLRLTVCCPRATFGPRKIFMQPF